MGVVPAPHSMRQTAVTSVPVHRIVNTGHSRWVHLWSLDDVHSPLSLSRMDG